MSKPKYLIGDRVVTTQNYDLLDLKFGIVTRIEWLELSNKYLYTVKTGAQFKGVSIVVTQNEIKLAEKYPNEVSCDVCFISHHVNDLIYHEQSGDTICISCINKGYWSDEEE